MKTLNYFRTWFSDRFYTVAITLIILKLGGYLGLPWVLIIACALVAFTVEFVCGVMAGLAVVRGSSNDEAVIIND